MTDLKTAKEAATYFQTYIRTKDSDWHDLKRESGPKAGYGFSELLRFANNAIGFTSEFTNENFLNCRIPEDFGSPDEFLRKLSELNRACLGFIGEIEAELTKIDDTSTVSGPVWYILEELRSSYDTSRFTLGWLNGGHQVAETPTENIFNIIRTVSEKLPSIVQQFSNRTPVGRPPLRIDDEYDLQYLFMGLIRLYFDDVRREETGPSSGGTGTRIDIFLPLHETFIELKCMRDSLSQKKLASELADDYVRYSKDARCKNLFIVVYDPSRRIVNPAGFMADHSHPRPPIDRVQTFIVS